MQILRQGGELLRGPKYRPRTALAVIVAAAALLLAAGFGSTAPLTRHDPATALVPGLLVLLVALCASPRLLAGLRALRRGGPGERLDVLLERLPNDYYLINDVALRTGRVDHVLAGPCGIVVIATRRISGHVQCDGDQWAVDGRPRKSYSRRARANAIAVRKFLAARYPEFKREIVRTIVVFTDPRCELHVRQPEVTVVRGADVLTRVVELGLSRQMDRGLVHVAAHRLAGDGPARFSVCRPSPRSGTGR